MRTICQTCGGDNIHQFKTATATPNLSDFEWDDHYYCTDCEDECLIDEEEESV